MEAEVPTLMEIVDAIGAGPVDLVGHSDGATIALLAAAWHPHRVRLVVSIAGHTFVEPQTTSIQALQHALQGGAAPAWLRRLHGDRGGPLLDAWADVWLGQVHAKWDVRSELSALRCPVLALQGDADEFGSDQQLAVIGEWVRDAEIWRLRGGHSPQHDAADEFVRRVGDLWRRS
jgi:pimeloyl-ACP methyl ester carboxylesterase